MPPRPILTKTHHQKGIAVQHEGSTVPVLAPHHSGLQGGVGQAPGAASPAGNETGAPEGAPVHGCQRRRGLQLQTIVPSLVPAPPTVTEHDFGLTVMVALVTVAV